MQRMRGVAERLSQSRERFRIAIIAVDVAHELASASMPLVEAVLAGFEAVADLLAEPLDSRAGARDADQGTSSVPCFTRP